MYTIPFNRPFVVGTEHRYIAEAIDNGQISGDGPFTERCQRFLARELGVPCVLLTTSCTHALEMAAILLDISPGDEVILPSFTFVSTANSFALRGARLVFVDIRPDTLNLDETQLEGLVTPRTKAIVPVHYAGVGCEMDRILDVARHHRVAVVEDNAHGLFGQYKGKPLGTFGSFATLSFHETKNITCGEGGALLINDERFIERAEIVRQKGTNRSRFLRGEVDRYTWVDVGSSYPPSEILAAFLWAQLEAHKQIRATRRRLWEYYYEALGGWAPAHGIELPALPQHCDQSYHMFYLLLPTTETRQALIAHLKARGILAVFHYVPLHSSEMGRRFTTDHRDCPVTDSFSSRLLRLPFYNDLSEPEQARVVAAIREFVG